MAGHRISDCIPGRIHPFNFGRGKGRPKGEVRDARITPGGRVDENHLAAARQALACSQNEDEVIVQLPIYMDNHATTPVDPRVVEEMLPFFNKKFGNPASRRHNFGTTAREAVESARESIARGIGATAEEIVFTSGATEANNLAIRGICDPSTNPPVDANHIVSVVTEHHSVLEPLSKLRKRGHEFTLLRVAPHGRVDAGIISLDELADAIQENTVLVSLMLGNNVIGAIQPLREIGRICREKDVFFHTDATQAAGKVPIDVDELQVDFMSISAHKMYGPKGIGALYVRRGKSRAALESQIDGGRQEGGLRGGTLNVPAIVGFAKAFELCLTGMPTETERIREMRNRMANGLQERIEGLEIVGPSLEENDLRLAGNLNCIFPGVSSASLVDLLGDSVAVSNGSACVSDDNEPSHVLVFLELSNDAARSSLRFGLGRFNTDEEVSFAVEVVAKTVRELRL